MGSGSPGPIYLNRFRNPTTRYLIIKNKYSSIRFRERFFFSIGRCIKNKLSETATSSCPNVELGRVMFHFVFIWTGRCKFRVWPVFTEGYLVLCWWTKAMAHPPPPSPVQKRKVDGRQKKEVRVRNKKLEKKKRHETTKPIDVAHFHGRAIVAIGVVAPSSVITTLRWKEMKHSGRVGEK